MNILVSGSSGMVGSALMPALQAEGHRVVRLRRQTGAATATRGADEAEDIGGTYPARERTAADVDEVAWDPALGFVDVEALDRLDAIDAVVHLAGAGIADRRWTPARKKLILDSRVQGTTLLCETMAARPKPPSVFLCASAVGLYGNRGDERLDERSSPGGQEDSESATFATEVVKAWEAAAVAADPAVTRTAFMRFGIVLSAKGGALAAQLPFFRLGLGGRIGSGRQWVSWITIDDAVRAVLFLLDRPVAGPVNLTSPKPVTNAQFTKALGRALRRPTLIAIPKPALWLRLGRELTHDLLEAGTHVSPAVLLEAGFEFDHPWIDEALAAVLA